MLLSRRQALGALLSVSLSPLTGIAKMGTPAFVFPEFGAPYEEPSAFVLRGEFTIPGSLKIDYRAMCLVLDNFDLPRGEHDDQQA